MKYRKFRISGTLVKLSAELASKGQIAIAYGRLHKCEGCGHDAAYSLKTVPSSPLLVPSSPLLALSCACGRSYAEVLS